MTVLPFVEESDLDGLGILAPDLDFSDTERRTVLLENRSCDVNAAPGSGKTTVLAAKLLMLARKWAMPHRGICMLSHTNVAREEIEKRLAASVDGARLLAHPHFIGTIHAFVDRFLALPLLRSTGLNVDVIDDDVFARRAVALANKNYPIRTWAEKNAGVMPMVQGLVFRGAKLELGSESGALPSAQAKTYLMLKSIKDDLTAKGVFRYADMFAFAERLLDQHPAVRQRLSLRFPYVFLDEMQDTSWEQEQLLDKMFDASVVVQRFGDVDQRILGGGSDTAKLTFPRPGAWAISTSKRFGPAIAAVVSGVRIGGQAVVGQGLDVHPPMLLTYSTTRASEVIESFGREVLARFTDAQLSAGPVRALCARKQSEGKAEHGRSLTDYWPAYAFSPSTKSGQSATVWPLVGNQEKLVRAGGLHEAAAAAKRAVLLVLRSANSPHVAGIFDSSHWLHRLRETGHKVENVQALVRDIALSSGWTANAESRAQVASLFFERLAYLLPPDMSSAAFGALEVFEAPANESGPQTDANACHIVDGTRRLVIDIGTIASMKGETHLATLVLESLGHPSKKLDIAEALPMLACTAPPKLKWSDSVQSQMRNLHVAMSRPTSLLCVAANIARVPNGCIDALRGKGWQIVELHA